MLLFVQSNTGTGLETLCVNAELEDTTQSLKAQISVMMNTQVDELTLAYNDEILNDGLKLSNYGIVHESTIDCQITKRDDLNISDEGKVTGNESQGTVGNTGNESQGTVGNTEVSAQDEPVSIPIKENVLKFKAPRRAIPKSASFSGDGADSEQLLIARLKAEKEEKVFQSKLAAAIAKSHVVKYVSSEQEARDFLKAHTRFVAIVLPEQSFDKLLKVCLPASEAFNVAFVITHDETAARTLLHSDEIIGHCYVDSQKVTLYGTCVLVLIVHVFLLVCSLWVIEMLNLLLSFFETDSKLLETRQVFKFLRKIRGIEGANKSF
ncbi:hypothetical protein AQUCO_00600107v1 [Aquilegia coerulea]|nr:hypothetical protein AQUCO_00600107v1 [Aquilegia coerulea]